MFLLEADPQQAAKIEVSIKKLFENPTAVIYEGYVDDPRNTDNAWMETSCTLFHDEDGSLTELIELTAGDDAADCQWVTVDIDEPRIEMYASHKDFMIKCLEYIKTNN